MDIARPAMDAKSPAIQVKGTDEMCVHPKTNPGELQEDRLDHTKTITRICSQNLPR